jgi:hypothetical protein
MPRGNALLSAGKQSVRPWRVCGILVGPGTHTLLEVRKIVPVFLLVGKKAHGSRLLRRKKSFHGLGL